MSEIIERPTGLPGSLAEMACPEGALRPLPINKIMEIVLEAMDIEDMDEEYPMCDFWNPLSTWILPWTKNNLQFGDWTYYITGCMIWEADYLIVEFMAEKDNMDIPIVLGGLGNYGYLHDKDYNRKAYGILEEMEHLLNKVDRNIVQWNRICTRSKPIIYKKPPIKEAIDDMLEYFMTLAESDYEYYGYEHKTFESFIEGYELSYDSVSRALAKYQYIEFGPFKIEFTDSFMDSQKCIIRAFLHIEGVYIYPLLHEKTYDLYQDSLMFDDADLFLEAMFEDITDSLIQWNEIMSGRRSANGNSPQTAKKKRKSLVSPTS